MNLSESETPCQPIRPLRLAGRHRYCAVILVALLLAVVWVASFVYPMTVTAQPQVQPKTPHAVKGSEDCLQCHAIGGQRPVPNSHKAYSNSECLGCHPADSAKTQTGSCLDCHGEPGLRLTLPSGEDFSLYVDAATFATSVHGNKLTCSDCHRNIYNYPHPKREFTNRRNYTIAEYELCKRCHFANYTKTLDSMHFNVLSSGDTRAPVCVDCHGAHNVARPQESRAGISRTCSTCHQGVYQTYAGSVHGKALLEENPDVPACTTCHGTHSIHDPRTASFRLETPELCAGCHSDEKLMRKYGLSSKVLKTYLQDFHGVSVSLYEKQSPDIWSYKAVCTDCHGIHDIRETKDPESSVIRANLVNVCRKCHSDATDNFPAAWLSHYEPSPTKAPLTYYVRVFYWTLIPFIVGGLSLHILLDLWRVATNR